MVVSVRGTWRAKDLCVQPQLRLDLLGRLDDVVEDPRATLLLPPASRLGPLWLRLRLLLLAGVTIQPIERGGLIRLGLPLGDELILRLGAVGELVSGLVAVRLARQAAGNEVHKERLKQLATLSSRRLRRRRFRHDSRLVRNRVSLRLPVVVCLLAFRLLAHGGRGSQRQARELKL